MKRTILIKICVIASVVALCLSGFYELVIPGHRISQSKRSVEQRLEIILSSTDMISSMWCSSLDREKFLDKVWQMATPHEWIENNVSLYLFQGKKMVFWSNHNYCDANFDSIVLAGSSTAITIDSSKVLAFVQGDSLFKAVATIELYNNTKGANSAVFDNPNIKIEPCNPHYGIRTNNNSSSFEVFGLLGKTFIGALPLHERNSWIFSLLGWFGVFSGLVAFVLYMARHTPRTQVWQRSILVLLLLSSLRIVFNYIDFPQGASHSFHSLNAMLISQLMILLLISYLYFVRQKIKWRMDRMTRQGQWCMLLFFTFVMACMILYSHFIMLDVIFSNTMSVEVYNLFSMSKSGFLFYVICSIFASYRILYSFLGRVIFAKFSPQLRALLSLAILATIAIPLQKEIHHTAYYLLGFHTLFVLLSSRRDNISRNRLFLWDITILALYIGILIANETRVAKQNEAQQYAKELTHGLDNAEISYPDITYSIISKHDVSFKPGYQIELSLILPYFSTTENGVFRSQDYVHIIQKDGSRVIVVSYLEAGVLDFMALICYIFLGLYLVSGLILNITGINVYNGTSYHTLANKVRFVVVGIVISSMLIVAWIVYQYSETSYQSKQRELLNGSLERLIDSFNKYCMDSHHGEIIHQNPDSMIMNWYNSRGSAFSADIALYSNLGTKIGESKHETRIPTKLDHDAWRAIAVERLPYFDKYSQDHSTAYTALFMEDTKVGYISVVMKDVNGRYTRYTLLGSIFNVFVLMLVLSIILSVILYSLVSGPIRTLTQSMQKMGNLQKIPVKEGVRMDDEVGRLIVQYNRMVDFLEESYQALARSEREGAWRDMARQVAHEIKNPLTPMRLKIQMLQRARQQGSPQLEERLDSTLELLMEQIDVLANIATEFSDLARLEQSSTVLIELDPILIDVANLYNTNTIDVKFEPQTPAPLFVMASYTTMWRLLVNLVQNATQAIDGCGSIHVRLFKDGEFAVVEIQDTGRGIDENLLEKIFEPNFTTKSTGSGLGLAIARQIALSFRGTISVKSSLGQGSTFTLRLPLA